MIKFNAMSGMLSVGRESIDVDHPSYMDYVAKYAIQVVAQGQSLSTLPLETLPPLYKILGHIEKDKDLLEELTNAESKRMSVIKEQLIQATKVYANNPSTENRDVALGLEKIYSSLVKQNASSGSFIVNFNKVLPDTFWDKPTEYEVDTEGNYTKEVVDAE